MLLENAIATKATKMMIENGLSQFCNFKASVSLLARKSIPNTKGRANVRRITFITSKELSVTTFNNSAVGAYKPAQKAKLNGVITRAAIVEKAVRLTESATLPFAKEVIKLEILPPGQAATSIIPNAMLGVGSINTINIYVKNGRTINCENMPTNAGFGVLDSLLKSSTFSPSATPNIMMAKHKLRAHKLC